MKFSAEVLPSERNVIGRAARQIIDVGQMYHRPGRRCYIMSINGLPMYRLSFGNFKDSRWYGWISVNKKDDTADSLVNPWFPMSDTAKGAVKNELGKTVFVDRFFRAEEVPVIIYEFRSIREAKEYFDPVLQDREPGFVWRW